MQSSVHVSIEDDGERILLSPSRNGGTRGDAKGFHYLSGRALVLDAPQAPEDLGHALLEAWSRRELSE